MLENSNFWTNEEGTENYDINGYRISQSHDGMVKITILLNNNKTLIRTSPSNSSVTITTPTFHCTASLRETSHMFVRYAKFFICFVLNKNYIIHHYLLYRLGERRIHSDGATFNVRNAGHSAALDEKNLLRVY